VVVVVVEKGVERCKEWLNGVSEKGWMKWKEEGDSQCSFGEKGGVNGMEWTDGRRCVVCWVIYIQ
jgi:hypothetical protein